MGTDYTVNLNDLETTGVIECPYCGRSKAYVYKNATGMISTACNVCNRIILYDFDNGKAYKANAKKYVS